jgi:hypothetical protein
VNSTALGQGIMETFVNMVINLQKFHKSREFLDKVPQKQGIF